MGGSLNLVVYDTHVQAWAIFFTPCLSCLTPLCFLPSDFIFLPDQCEVDFAIWGNQGHTGGTASTEYSKRTSPYSRDGYEFAGLIHMKCESLNRRGYHIVDMSANASRSDTPNSRHHVDPFLLSP